MGLRAFTIQLLCEQVVGRGLRRASYDVNPHTGLFTPEYVNVLGVPFTFLPTEGIDEKIRTPPKPTTSIEAYDSKKQYQISWPNIIRIDRTYLPILSLAWDKVRPLTIDPSSTSLIIEMAPIVDGKPHVDKITTIDLEKLLRDHRLQTSMP
jgi:type III restriction enzyme